MTCVKTGVHVYIDEYGEYAYGDAFLYSPWHNGFDKQLVLRRLSINERSLINDTLLIRASCRSLKPINSMTVVHFRIRTVSEWFGRHNEIMHKHPSTIISNNYENFGYEGIEIEKLMRKTE